MKSKREHFISDSTGMQMIRRNVSNGPKVKNSSNRSCWKGYKKVGTKPSQTNKGETVNDCKEI